MREIPLLVSVLVFVFGLFKWTYEASTTRARQAGLGNAGEQSQLGSVIFFSEVALFGVFALGFYVFGLIMFGLGSPVDAEAEAAQNQALLVVHTFLILALGLLAWAVNRWAFRRRSAYLIPAIVPIAAVIALQVARDLIAT